MAKRYKHLFENYYLDNDYRNIILLEKKVSKSNVIRYEKIGYYPKISQLIQGMKEHIIVHSITELEFDELIAKLEYINRL